MICPDCVTHFHASFYGLIIICILNDSLANIRIQILSDDIDLDCVPAKAESKEEVIGVCVTMMAELVIVRLYSLICDTLE
jgi:hypothetical protein